MPKKTTPAGEPEKTKAVVYTFKDWQNNGALQAELRALLDHPVLKHAFQTILHAAMPSAPPVSPIMPGISAEAIALTNNNRYMHRSGMTHVYRIMHALARPKTTAKAGSEWGELIPEDE